MRWPFGPPHLTFKPSKKNTKKQQKNKNKKTKKKQKKQQKNKKKKNQERNSKKHKIPKKSFSVISQNFLFYWKGIQKLLFLTPWPRKRAPKNTIKIGVSAYFFGKKLCVTKRPFLDKKKPKFRNSSYHCFSCLFLSFKNKNHKNLLKPLFL